jgi:hypothetical protein
MPNRVVLNAGKFRLECMASKESEKGDNLLIPLDKLRLYQEEGVWATAIACPTLKRGDLHLKGKNANKKRKRELTPTPSPTNQPLLSPPTDWLRYWFA